MSPRMGSDLIRLCRICRRRGQNGRWGACFHVSDGVFAFADSIRLRGTNGDAVPACCASRVAVMFIRRWGIGIQGAFQGETGRCTSVFPLAASACSPSCLPPPRQTCGHRTAKDTHRATSLPINARAQMSSQPQMAAAGQPKTAENAPPDYSALPPANTNYDRGLGKASCRPGEAVGRLRQGGRRGQGPSGEQAADCPQRTHPDGRGELQPKRRQQSRSSATPKIPWASAARDSHCWASTSRSTISSKWTSPTAASTPSSTRRTSPPPSRTCISKCEDLPVLGNVRVGHFKECFGLEQLTSDNYTTFMERSRRRRRRVLSPAATTASWRTTGPKTNGPPGPSARSPTRPDTTSRRRSSMTIGGSIWRCEPRICRGTTRPAAAAACSTRASATPTAAPRTTP